MTDARLPEQWLLDLDLIELRPTAWRFFTFALMFCNAQGTDGRLREGHLRLIPVDISDQDISDVIATGRLKRVPGGGYQFVDWDKRLGQSTAASVEARREQNRINQAKARDRKKNRTQPPGVSSDVSDDVSNDDQGEDTAAIGTGQGQDELPPHDPETGEIGWATTRPPVTSITDDYCNSCGLTGRHTGSCKKAKEAA